ncbi:hypothetical protein SAMN04489761_3694 [Tenacibaculum sp. MAR_2009_124]|uniref:hypothetical protein n=1 Tax=Tenacibaculum sp. MAR_2009_124 TaxID=1250059 RepID=UPI000896B267|nr:hypothetical protein [Tenacibaculum sp. MAR_2009_124]SEC82602.1 hypothetical protein SAMN04489761_3694 [Tenacibaculum sp. MAR_2009_124]
MIFTSDKSYKTAKAIKLGNTKIKEEFKLLAKWIDNKYKVKTLNIIFDYIDNKISCPRLQICLEFSKDKGSFMNNRTFNWNKNKQKEIKNKFTELVDIENISKRSNWIHKIFGFRYNMTNLYVHFTDFESIAKIEANENIPKEKIEDLKLSLQNEGIWDIVPISSSVIYFLDTNQKVKECRDSNIHKKWNNQYFNILKEHDEFRYFKKGSFRIHLDSKENFEKKYNSNWYSYLRG